MTICSSKIEPRIARKLSGSPCAAGNALDGHLAGLLTYASMNLKRLPGSSRPFTPTSGEKWRPSSGMLPRFSAHTVAGQWRILTALPITRWRKVISESRSKVKRSQIEIEFPIPISAGLHPSLGCHAYTLPVQNKKSFLLLRTSFDDLCLNRYMHGTNRLRMNRRKPFLQT